MESPVDPPPFLFFSSRVDLHLAVYEIISISISIYIYIYVDFLLFYLSTMLRLGVNPIHEKQVTTAA